MDQLVLVSVTIATDKLHPQTGSDVMVWPLDAPPAAVAMLSCLTAALPMPRSSGPLRSLGLMLCLGPPMPASYAPCCSGQGLVLGM